jgi:hypothetical protein
MQTQQTTQRLKKTDQYGRCGGTKGGPTDRGGAATKCGGRESESNVPFWFHVDYADYYSQVSLFYFLLTYILVSILKITHFYNLINEK